MYFSRDAGFVVQKATKVKLVKGDKESAKAHPEIATSSSIVDM